MLPELCTDSVLLITNIGLPEPFAQIVRFFGVTEV